MSEYILERLATFESDDHRVEAGQRTLADFNFGRGVYGIGRLDRDSEGLLLLSDDPAWTDRLLNPRRMRDNCGF